MIPPKSVGIPHQPQNDETATPEGNEPPPRLRNLVHKVSPHETLGLISIMYNKSKEDIKRVNDLVGDEIYMRRELIIPNCSKSSQI